MPVAIRSPFKPLTAVVSKYITSQRARVQAQQQASGTTTGPTGAEVDAHVASTLSKSKGAAILASQPTLSSDIALTAQVDSEGRTLGLEDANDPALQDDPHLVLHATARPRIVPTSSVTDSALLQEVFEVTYGAQTSIPLFAAPTSVSTTIVDANQYGFVDPRSYGGSSFDLVGNGMHEPLNVIISSHSSAEILTRKGFQSYCRSLDFDKECLGLHAGGFQKAFIDPRGWRDQEFIYREVYTPLDHVFGTCIESLVGGNHIRAWQQQASGAWFLATSREQDASKNHMIIPNGYNIGRNQLVQQALGKAKDGRKSFMLTKYKTDVQFVAGLMPQGVQGVNHDIAVDGLTAVLTVTILPDKSWFSARDSVPSAVMVVDDEEGGEHVAGGAVAPADETRAVGEKTEQKRQRRVSLAQRFSLARPLRESQDGRENKAEKVWQKLKRLSVPKHQPASEAEARTAADAADGAEGTASNDTVLAANTDGLPSSVDSASTAAETADHVHNTDASKVQPTGLVVSAPPIAA